MKKEVNYFFVVVLTALVVLVLVGSYGYFITNSKDESFFLSPVLKRFVRGDFLMV
ncbi:hypothetical protein HYV50_02590 [Candidatus Pacearchaeota archaeon]|nr:hypothetical protein [Candidatus Pacearchaeota archaeon]